MIRIATWNVNGLRARLDFLIHWLHSRSPDIVGLQELKVEDEQFPHDVLAEEGYHVITHGQKAWNGVAVLSRQPAEVMQSGLPGQEEFGARLLSARVQGIDFTTVYCPNGKHLGHDDFPRKLAWFDDLREFLSRQNVDESASVVCGDFNICPTGLDSWHEEEGAGRIFHTDEERERFQALVDLRLTDTFRHLHPEAREYSWWDYRAGGFYRNHGLRIDTLLGSPRIVERLVNAEIDRDYRKKKEGLTASDHAPVFIDLE